MPYYEILDNESNVVRVIVADLDFVLTHFPGKFRRVTESEGQVAARFDALVSRLVAEIDGTVADVYARWLRFEAEYVAREGAARAYLADGTLSDWVTDFAVPAGLTNNQAAALIVSQADALRTALRKLGGLRMEKYKVLAAGSASEAEQEHQRILGSIKAIAEAL